MQRKRSLERDGSTYPWRRMLARIYGLEGSDLANHLVETARRATRLEGLAEIEDLKLDSANLLNQFCGDGSGVGT